MSITTSPHPARLSQEGEKICAAVRCVDAGYSLACIAGDEALVVVITGKEGVAMLTMPDELWPPTEIWEGNVCLSVSRFPDSLSRQVASISCSCSFEFTATVVHSSTNHYCNSAAR